MVAQYAYSRASSNLVRSALTSHDTDNVGSGFRFDISVSAAGHSCNDGVLWPASFPTRKSIDSAETGKR